MSEAALKRIRKICLALPETTEESAHTRPVFKVRGKTFVMFLDNHHDDGRLAIWCKAPIGAREVMLDAAPDRFFIPRYVGHQGWVGLRLDRGGSWDEVAAVVKDSYQLFAPKPRRR
jgi:hypothetical protein